MSGPTPGWYDDPSGHGGQRWWDGQRWTSGIRPSAPDAQVLPPTDPEVTSVTPEGGAVDPSTQASRRAGGRRGLLVLGGVLLAGMVGAAGWLASGAGGDDDAHRASDPPGQPAAEDGGEEEQPDAVAPDAVAPDTVAPDASDEDGSDEWATDLARRLNAGTSQLSFRRVRSEIAPGEPRYDEGPDCQAPAAERGPLPLDEPGILCASADAANTDPATEELLPSTFEVGPAELTGDNLEEAVVEVDPGSGRPAQVVLHLDEEGAEVLEWLTADLACERDQGQEGRFAIVIDGSVASAPGVNPSVACGVGITGGTATITGGSPG